MVHLNYLRLIFMCQADRTLAHSSQINLAGCQGPAHTSELAEAVRSHSMAAP